MILAALLATATAMSPGPIPASDAVVPPAAHGAPVAAGVPQAQPQAQAQAQAPPKPGPGPVGGVGFLSAGSLRQKCEDTSAVMVSYCYAYITGVHDSVRAYETWLNMREFCRPVRTSQADLRRAVIEYLTENPQAASGEAASVVVVALKQKYACASAAKAPSEN